MKGPLKKLSSLIRPLKYQTNYLSAMLHHYTTDGNLAMLTRFLKTVRKLPLKNSMCLKNHTIIHIPEISNLLTT